MQTKKTADLTTGSPFRTLCVYALPILISAIFQQAYSIADSLVAGSYIGTEALGVVGTCYPLTTLLTSIASGLSLGATIHGASCVGQQQYGQLRQCISTSLIFFIPLSIVLAVIGIAGTPVFITLLNVPESMVDITVQYFRIYLLGFPFLFMYNLSNAILIGVGDSRSPLLFLVISSIVNVLLAFLFGAVMHLGTKGLACATVLAQFTGAVLGVVSVRAVYAGIDEDSPKFSGNTLKTLLSLGVPSMLQQILISVGQLSLQSVVNTYGAIVIAAYSITSKINGIFVSTEMALSNALSVFIAQNNGAGNKDRSLKGISTSLIMAFVFALLFDAVLLLFGEKIFSLFLSATSEREEIIEVAAGYFRVLGPFYLMVCNKVMCDGALRGEGAMKLFLLATFSDTLIRVLAGNLFSSLWGITGVWWVWPAAWLVSTVLSCGSLAIILHGKRRKYLNRS